MRFSNDVVVPISCFKLQMNADKDRILKARSKQPMRSSLAYILDRGILRYLNPAFELAETGYTNEGAVETQCCTP